ncbi:MAG: hypothetical protein V3S69_08040 [Dehalococcoidales bacterium]
MKTLQGQEIFKLIALARTLLVRARIAKQYSVVVMENPNNIGPASEIRRVATSYRQDAYAFRQEAREVLKFVERANGRRYMRGLAVLPLMSSLNGRAFRNWEEHETEYEFEILYQGIDPC